MHMYILTFLFSTFRYSFISLMNPFTVLYTMPMCACIFSLSITYWRRELEICYHKVLNNTDLNILTKNYKRSYNFSILFIMIIATIITLSIDVYHHHTTFSIFNWICLYWPGIAISNNMIHIANLINAATYNYELINLYLEKYTHQNLTPVQKFKMSEKYEIPNKLMQRFPGSQYTIFHKIFIMHDENSRVVRLANKIAGKSKRKFTY